MINLMTGISSDESSLKKDNIKFENYGLQKKRDLF